MSVLLYFIGDISTASSVQDAVVAVIVAVIAGVIIGDSATGISVWDSVVAVGMSNPAPLQVVGK